MCPGMPVGRKRPEYGRSSRLRTYLQKWLPSAVHLDDSLADNGPLRVLPGSHRDGWLDDQLDDWKKRVPEVVCTVRCGGVLSMCPLTLHASAPSKCPSHRRVIHLEYAAADLPVG